MGLLRKKRLGKRERPLPMKFTLGWLKDHLDTDASIEAISTALSAIGLEVDGIEDPAEQLGAFTIARVVEAAKHPNADKLQVLQVEIEPGKPTVEVVCGAPNARAGMLAVFAPIGTYVPGLDVTLVKKPVRGVESNGMMCSAGELELAGDSDGILDVDASMADKIGERYIDALGLNDPVFDVALTPNRPDCTGVRGIARDLAAAGLGTLKPMRDFGDVDGPQPCPVAITLQFNDAEAGACPVFAGRVLEGVKNDPSPEWLANRLTAIGLRPINALVDVTNYISYDLGRPLHVYDADKLSGAVSARLGKAGESFVGLDEKTYAIDDAMCVIADDSGPLGLGGVMGGLASGSTETTSRVLIESAWFDPIRTAQTGRKAGLNTDARYRFERGVDPLSVVPGLDLATRMILDICGGTPSQKTVAGTEPNPNTVVAFDPARVEKLTGLNLPVADIRRILTDLGFNADEPEDTGMMQVAVPSWRPDVTGPADLVEEVLRIAGIDTVVSTPLPRLSGIARATLTPAQLRARRTRRTLAGRGLVEAITWSFVPRAEAEMFAGDGSTVLELDNPISVELSTMRPTVLPGLLGATQRNRNRGADDVALFELGQAYRGAGERDQIMVAGGVRAGTAKLTGGGRHWDGAASPVTAFDVKADVLAVLAALGIDPEKPQITRDAPQWYHPGQSGTLRLGPKMVLGHFGLVHPRTLKALDVDEPVAAFEIFLDALPQPKKKAKRARSPLQTGDLMPVKRDFAFVVGRDTLAGDLVRAARGAEKALIQNVTVFDVFEGGQLAEQGQKSLALEVTLQPVEATLTDKEIEAVAEKVIAAVKKATGGEIRR